ncbi:MAG: YCF48-related protein [Planctomycetaceae bacterium]
MRARHRSSSCYFLTFILCLVSASDFATAQETVLPRAAAPAVADKPALVASWQDDVCFHDVQCLGGQRVWAVGDHGTIWSSNDGGVTWGIIPCPTTASLRSVQFLTDRVGWVAGGEFQPQTQLSRGVIYFTEDGGVTWNNIAHGPLPPISKVRFFTMQIGVAVGQATAEHPTGVMFTRDGGVSWQDAPGPASTGWQTADFLNPDVGVVAGLRGQVALVGEGRLMQPQIGRFGLKGIRAAKLLPQETGWMVGDGGLVLYTNDGGVVWKESPGPLPDEVAEIMNFRAVACRDQHVWIAGSPGSVIWHSADAGRTWSRQFTGQTLPISSLSFADADNGFACGPMGTILRTTDGGRTWTAVRGELRRTAILQFGGRPDELSMSLIAKFSGELGYRSVCVLPIRRDLDPQARAGDTLESRLHQAVTQAGGNAAELGWQFPVDAPDLERVRPRLREMWNIHAEGKLDRVLMQNMVALIRTWRPNIVVIAQPTDNSAGTRVLHQSLLRAVPHAADPTYLIEQAEFAGLTPWSVDYVYQREPAPNVGHDRLDSSEYLARWGTSLELATDPSRSLLMPKTDPFTSQPDAEIYRVIYRDPSAQSAQETGGRFFAGLSLVPGTEARRKLTNPDDTHLEKHRKQANEQRNFRSISKRMFDDPRQAAQALAHIRTMTAQWTRDAAAAQMSQLAIEYGRRHQWDLVEATYVELVQRFPDHPLSAEAMKWLLTFWSSTETAWQRSRKTQVSQTNYTVQVSQTIEQIAMAVELSKVKPRDRDSIISPEAFNELTDPTRVAGESIDERIGSLKVGPRDEWRSAAVQNWQTQALRLAHVLNATHVQLYQSADVQFPLAALVRERGQPGMADTLYRRQRHLSKLDPGDRVETAIDLDLRALAAAGELWLVQPASLPPKPVYLCTPVGGKPVLDALLSDACWEEAQEIALTPAANGASTSASNGDLSPDDDSLVLVSYDGEFLYLAASVPIHPALPDDPPAYPGRLPDTDLHEFDRLSFYLDVDRDYFTAYELHVDQRGWTGDACAGDRTWNPTWFVAAERDATRWRIECAIPWAELTPTPPQPGQVWNLRVVRTLPAFGLEYWPAIKKSEQQHATMDYGFLRFE